MKIKSLKKKNILLYFWGYPLEPSIGEIWHFFLNFGQIVAIENLKKHSNLVLLIFNFSF
jgi:hypothetical protein